MNKHLYTKPRVINGKRCEDCSASATYAVGDFKQLGHSDNFKLDSIHYYCDVHKRDRRVFHTDGKRCQRDAIVT